MHVPNLGFKIVGIFIFLGLCFVTFTTLFFAAGGKNPLSDPYSVTVRVPDGFQLVPHSDVRRLGVKVGTVRKSLSSPKTGSGGIYEIAIDDENSKPLHRNAILRLRTKTLVGENYLDLDPGAAPSPVVPDGGKLDETRGDEVVQIDQVLDTLNGPTQRQIRRAVQSSGEALQGNGDNLNRLFTELEPFTRNANNALAVAQKRRKEVAEVLEQTGRVMDAIGSRQAQVQTLATSARRTAEAVSRRDGELRAGLDGLPPLLAQARQTLGLLSGLSRNATPVVNDLAVGFDALRPAVQRLAPAARSTRALVRELPPFVKAANPMLDNLPKFSQKLGPGITSLDSFLAETNPMLDYLRPFVRDIGSFVANTGSFATGSSPGGKTGRVLTTFSESTLNNVPPSADRAIEALIASNAITRSFLNEQENAQPAPGSINKPDGRQHYERVDRGNTDGG
jgi:phospholipid/cholesterol/gamma-HCH transport system substrate-binding protein